MEEQKEEKGVVIKLLFVIVAAALILSQIWVKEEKKPSDYEQLVYSEAWKDYDDKVANKIMVDGQMEFKIILNNEEYNLILKPEETEEYDNLQLKYKEYLNFVNYE